VRLARAWTDDVAVCLPAELRTEVDGARVVTDPTAFGPRPGPLVALAWALHESRRPWTLVLAVDMPLARRQLFDLLWEQRQEPASDAPEAPSGVPPLGVVPWRRHGPEPLLALYRRDAGAALLALAQGGERAAVRAVPGLPLVRVPEEVWRAADPDGHSFLNCNTPEEWRLVEELAASADLQSPEKRRD
jgi:molybdopterin-guanine dinucleotide biosynthesis protein A